MTRPPSWLIETTECEDQLVLPPGGTFPFDTIWDKFALGSALGDFGTNSDVKKQVFGCLIGTSIYKTHSTLGSATPSVLSFGLGHKSEIDRTISQIEEFRSRKDGWKGSDSLGPTERTIDEAKTFATLVLADSKIESPHIGLAADGEIAFFWQNPKIAIDLRIAGDGTYAYFAKTDTGTPFFEDAAPITEKISPRKFSVCFAVRLDSDFRDVLQEVLAAEMTEAIGASKGERTEGRRGYRSGCYPRGFITRLGKIELGVPQDRQGRFSTELF